MTETEVPLTIGRWTVIKAARSARRRTSAKTRARVHVRCVCGIESIVWHEDLMRGHSNGCRSLKCAFRTQTVASLKEHLDFLASRDRQKMAIIVQLKAHLDRWVSAKRADDIDAAKARRTGEIEGGGSL